MAASHEQDRRILAVRDVLVHGLRVDDVARQRGVSRSSVYSWVKRYRQYGRSALKTKARRRSALSSTEQHQLIWIIVDSYPRMLYKELGVTGRLWTWRGIRHLVKEVFNRTLSRITITRYLRAWGLWPRIPQEYGQKQAPVFFWERSGLQSRQRVFIWGVPYRIPSKYKYFPNMDEEAETKRRRRRDFTLVTAVDGRRDRSFAVFEGPYTLDVIRQFYKEGLEHHIPFPLYPSIVLGRRQSVSGLLDVLNASHGLAWKNGKARRWRSFPVRSAKSGANKST